MAGQGFGQAKAQITVGEAAEVLFKAAQAADQPLAIAMFPPGNERGLKPGETAPGRSEVLPSCDGIVIAVGCEAEEAQALLDLIILWERSRLKHKNTGGDRNG